MTESTDMDKTVIYSAASKDLSHVDQTQLAPSRAINGQNERTRFIPKFPVSSDQKQLANYDRKILNATEAIQPTSDKMLLKNRFILEQLLGAGGMGVVYKAKDLLKIEAQDKDPYVAIKVLTDEFKTHPEAFIALQRESRKTQRIAHPNIVTVFDFDRDGDTVFMTMEYLDGSPLDKIIAQYRSIGLPHDEVFKIIEGLCAALSYAHAQRIIHSDFKPGNIFVNTKGVAKVIDFGIARAVAKVENRAESVDDKTLFDAGNLGALTPAYASVEMLEGKIPDIRDDIYALGCIIYELYTGNHPFNRVHADEAKKKKLKPKKISNIKSHQWKAIEATLAFERENRIASVDLFWKQFSHKPKRTYGVLTASLFAIAAASFTYYKLNENPISLFSEDHYRNEIEIKLRIEMMQKSLDELISSSIFDLSWENHLWDIAKDFQSLPSEHQPWVSIKRNEIYDLYINKINESLQNKDLTFVLSWLENAKRYGTDERLNHLEKEFHRLSDLQKRNEIEKNGSQKSIVIEATIKPTAEQQSDNNINKENIKRTEFKVALDNVNHQLSCSTTVDMKDLEIAINKLKSIDSSLYLKEENSIVKSLANCIQKVGDNYPERGNLLKTQSLRLFHANPTLQGLSFAAKDPCDVALAGQGARGINSGCRDKLPNGIKTPPLVVIPGRGNLKAFAIGAYEVSNEEFNYFCKETNSCDLRELDPSLPIVNLPISSIRAYLGWLSQKTGYSYRLPNFIEWQHAARAGGNQIDPNRNCMLNSRGINKGGLLIKHTIGQKNNWGLVNTLGNASEIVVGRGGDYLIVGGSYMTDIAECNFDTQFKMNETINQQTGFRVLREINQ